MWSVTAVTNDSPLCEAHESIFHRVVYLCHHTWKQSAEVVWETLCDADCAITQVCVPGRGREAGVRMSLRARAPGECHWLIPVPPKGRRELIRKDGVSASLLLAPRERNGNGYPGNEQIPTCPPPPGTWCQPSELSSSPGWREEEAQRGYLPRERTHS